MEFYKETEFRKTEIGRIPRNWLIESIKDVADVKGGKRLPKGEKLIDQKTPHPYIRILDFKEGKINLEEIKYLSPSTQKKISRYIISSDDVYISIAGTIGLAGLIPNELNGANLTENAAKLCNIRKVEKAFLSYLLNSTILQSQIKTFIGKGSQPKLALFRIEKLMIPLPTYIEQKNISQFLLLVDDAIQKTDEIIQKTQLLKKGLMKELLTKGIGHKELKYSKELGCEIPKEWDVVRIEDIIPDRKGAIKIGPFGSQLKKNEMVPDGIKVYGQENVLGHDFTIGDRYISEAKFTTLQSVEIFPGDVLISMMGSIGYSVVFPENTEKGIMDSHLIRIQVIKDKCVPLFLSRLINDAVVIKNQIKSMSQGAIMSGLNSQIIKRIQLPLPGTKEQEEINSILVNVDGQIEKERRTREELERLKKGLMQILLTGKVRVKVN